MSETHGNPSDPHAHGRGHGQSPPEPKTPMWLTALGVVLFLTVGLIWGLMPSKPSSTDGAGSNSNGGPATGGAGAPAR